MPSKNLVLTPKALEELAWWIKHDRKTALKIVNLIRECLKSPFSGTGKPEPLKGDLKGMWARRISKEHRLVYTVEEDIITIISCYSHYETVK